jgi:hypothetical protein
MFIDYVTLMLINLAAGLALLASYVYWGLDSSNQGCVAKIRGGDRLRSPSPCPTSMYVQVQSLQMASL